MDGLRLFLAVVLAGSVGGVVSAQAPAQQAGNAAGNASTNGSPAAAIGLVSDYRIGPGDVLGVVFWRQKDLSTDVAVRPDGRITLPLLNDVDASGLTPEELRLELSEKARRFVSDPTVTVVVKQIQSRQVYITGQIEKPGTYPLYGPLRVLQLIAAAGGLKEYADANSIVLVRTEGGRQTTFRFNYNDVVRRRDLTQNIELRPGDTVVIP